MRPKGRRKKPPECRKETLKQVAKVDRQMTGRMKAEHGMVERE
jgi:hypothetical protein